MKYFEKNATNFVLTEKEVPSAYLKKELDKGYIAPVAGSAGLGAVLGALVTTKKGIPAYLKNMAIGAGAGGGAASLGTLAKNKNIQDELKRRKENPGYR
jgi:phage tail tape-measure protein